MGSEAGIAQSTLTRPPKKSRRSEHHETMSINFNRLAYHVGKIYGLI